METSTQAHNHPPKAATTDDATPWVWLRVYYFESCKDHLLLYGIIPALTTLATNGRSFQYYFERDWLGGPHIVVGIVGALTLLDISQTVEMIQIFLREKPSTTAFNSLDYERRIAAAAALEARVDVAQERPLRSNNSVLIDTDEPFSPLLPPGILRTEMRLFLCKSTSIVLEWLNAIKEEKSTRDEIALQALTATAWAADPDLLRSHISYRSHSTAFLRYLDSPALIAEFQRRYKTSSGKEATSIVRDTVERLNAQRAPASITRYAILLREVLHLAYAGFASGSLGKLPVKQFRAADAADPNFATAKRLNQILKDDPVLQAWRLVINLNYLVMNQLGISALERYLGCYLVGRACEDLFALKSSEIAQALADTGNASAVITTLAQSSRLTLGNSLELKRQANGFN